MSLTLLSDFLMTMFMKQDAAAEQKGCQGRPDASKSNEEPTFHSRRVVCSSRQGGSSIIFDGMQGGIQMLENAPDISTLVGGFSIEYQFTVSMALTRCAKSFYSPII
jgi:hypothetical protein